MESQKLFVLISDPFGYGWDLFGTAATQFKPILTLETIWLLQVIAIIVGHVFGLYITHKHAYELFRDDRIRAVKCQIPLILPDDHVFPVEPVAGRTAHGDENGHVAGLIDGVISHRAIRSVLKTAPDKDFSAPKKEFTP